MTGSVTNCPVKGGERLRELFARGISTMLIIFSSVMIMSTTLDRWTMELPLVLRIEGSDLSLESTKEDDAKESQEIKRQERNQFDRPLGIFHTAVIIAISS